MAGFILLILISSVLGKGKEESSDSAVPEENTSVVETEQTDELVEEPAADEETEPVQTPEEEEYSVVATNGETLSAVPGFAKVLCTCDYSGTEREDANIFIPSMESFTNGDLKTKEETFADDHYERDFSCDQPSDGVFMEDYVAELVSNGGFTLENTIDISDDQKVYYLNYDGEITHGADEWLDTEYDISIMFYTDYDSSGVCFRYPSEVGFSFDGDSQTYYSCVDTEAEYNEEDGTDKFTISDWGTADDDYIYLDFKDEAYQAGDVITLDELVQQFNAEEDPRCKVSVWGPLVSGDSEAGIMTADKFTSGSIEIMEKSDEVTGDSEDEVETDSENDQENDSGGNDGPYFKVEDEQTCTFCGGSGKTTCHACGGDGFEQCPNCNGVGSYYNTILGMDETCGRCNGSGSIPCSSSHCVDGQVTCGSCNGTGKIN